ncbi:MAG: type VI secretion system tip protein VgrG [Deltaproteobacteria bacterium]|nr:type VI secretion system tip protein VgrG [Deltaproteobacteria bacterium]
MSNGGSTYSQENRIIAIDTPLGPDVLLLAGFRGVEGISELFSFELELYSTEDHCIKFEDIIGQNVTVTIYLADESPRYFNGVISRFGHRRGGGESGTETRFSYYNATMVPWFWLLTRTADARIFQNKNVPDIVKQIFDDLSFPDFSLRLQGSYDPREYAVQYRETDFNFVSRLLEEEGIYYFFEHEANKHTLVLADSPGNHKPCPNQEEARYEISGSGVEEEDVITRLEIVKEIRAGKYTMRDFNFKTPSSTGLEVTVDSKHPLGPGDREIYDYPGEYDKRKVGEGLVKVRIEEEEARITTMHGISNCRAFCSGFRFRLRDYFRDDTTDREFVLTRISHDVKQGGSYTGSGTGGETGAQVYVNNFTCMPHDVPFRPPRFTAKPVVEGVQTAIVVGPSGEEIFTDEHGRVKVQFHWDREGTNDQNSSCWIRVSQLWAGAGWGAMWIPRIGHEVIVDFLEGDPDRPIITGRVYHGNNVPPYPLPAEKTKSTIKSNSSKGGGGSNELRFEDKKGQEEIYLHGQKDWTIVIENNKNQRVGVDETHRVGHNRDKTVINDQSETIGKNKTITVGLDHNEIIGVNKTMMVGANHTETIGANMVLTVGANQAVTVGVASAETIGAAKALTIGAAYQVSVGAAMNESVGGPRAEEVGGSKVVEVGGGLTETVGKDSVHKAKKILLEAGDEITLKTGGASITMKKSGEIIIKGSKIKVQASGDVIIKGAKIAEN